MLVTVPRSALVSLRGDPVPPQAVVLRLRQLTGDRLTVAWQAGAHVPYWGLRRRWDESDARWERVRAGEISAANAWDLEHMFPRDCSPDDMAAYVEQRYGDRARSVDPAREAERIVEAAQKRRAAEDAANVDRVTTRSIRQHLDETPHSLRVRAGAELAHPMVPGGLTP